MSTENTKRRGRPDGSKNKSPFLQVPLAKLVEMLAPTAKVPVKKSFAIEILGLDDEVENESVNTSSDSSEDDEDDDKLTLKISQPVQDED